VNDPSALPAASRDPLASAADPADAASGRRPWTAPRLIELPRLVDLTLLSGDPLDGSGGSGGIGFP
jgi:hypothetical protein